ncbi:MAG: protein kinase [Dehalococcoidia bacterium]|nr:protein kinase [Dehalococcoidia bacterium]
MARADPRTSFPKSLSHYRLSSLIDTGTIGSVYLGVDRRDQTPVAIKLINQQFARDRTFRERFEIEWRLAAQLRSPYSARVFEGGYRDGYYYIAMEHVEGKTLAQTLAERGPLPPRRAARIASHAARALEEAETYRVVHGGLKPENMIILPAGRSAKLVDFGIAAWSKAASITQPGGVLSGMLYAAPEQARGRADHRSDIYSLGAVLYHMIAGRPPLDGGAMELATRPGATIDMAPFEGLPPALSDVVERCLQRDPRSRYPSATDLAGALDHAGREIASVTSLPPGAPPEPEEAHAEAPAEPEAVAMTLAETASEDSPDDSESPAVEHAATAPLVDEPVVFEDIFEEVVPITPEEPADASWVDDQGLDTVTRGEPSFARHEEAGTSDEASETILADEDVPSAGVELAAGDTLIPEDEHISELPATTIGEPRARRESPPEEATAPPPPTRPLEPVPAPPSESPAAPATRARGGSLRDLAPLLGAIALAIVALGVGGFLVLGRDPGGGENDGGQGAASAETTLGAGEVGATEDASEATAEAPEATAEPGGPIAPALPFADDFNDQDPNWDVEPQDEYTSYANGGLVVSADPGLTSSVRSTTVGLSELGDVFIEVDVVKLNGPTDTEIGLLCRADLGPNLYHFLIRPSDGFFRVVKQSGEDPQFEVLAEGTNAAITDLNHIVAGCVGAGDAGVSLTLNVNDQEVARVDDPAGHAPGAVGVEVVSFGLAAQVLFDNLVIREP